MKTNIDLPPPLIIVNGTTEVLESEVPEFIRLVSSNVSETRNEAGCLYYYMARDIIRPELFRLSEAWVDEPSHNAHLKSAHFTRFLKEIGHMTLKSVIVKRYSVVKEEDLAAVVPQR